MSRRSSRLKYENENGELEDNELRRRLEGLGYNPGPVTSTTRTVLLRKLTQLEEEKGKVKKAVHASAQLPFSSDDSDSDVVERPGRGGSSVYSLNKAPRGNAASAWSHVGSSRSSVLSPGRRSMPSVFRKTHVVASGNKIGEFQEERFSDDDDDDDDDDAEEPMEAEDTSDRDSGHDLMETEQYSNTLSSKYSTHSSTFLPGDSLFKKYGTSTKVSQVIHNPHDVTSRRSMGMINVNGQQVPRLSQSERDRLWSGSPSSKGGVGSLRGMDNSRKDWSPSTSSVLFSRETIPHPRGVGAVRSTGIGGATSADWLRQPYRGQSAGLVSPSGLSYRGGALSSSRRDPDPNSSFASKYQPLGKTQTTKYGISKPGGSAPHKAYGDAKLRDVFCKRYLSNVCKFGFCLVLLGALVVLALLFAAEDNGGDFQVYGAHEEKLAESFRKLYIMLAQKKGNYQCGYSNSSQISLADLKKMDDFQGYYDDMLKTLMTGTYKDTFIITGENGEPVDSFGKAVFLESLFSQKSILCRIHTALYKVIFRLLCMFVGFAIIWALVLYIRFWLKQREELRKQAFDLVDRIAALLQAQAEESQTVSFMEPYMSVLHVRDSLIQPRDRARLMKVWKMADDFISSHRESRIRTEYQVVNGEDCEVWRWVPGPSSPKTSRISHHL